MPCLAPQKRSDMIFLSHCPQVFLLFAAVRCFSFFPSLGGFSDGRRARELLDLRSRAGPAKSTGCQRLRSLFWNAENGRSSSVVKAKRCRYGYGSKPRDLRYLFGDDYQASRMFTGARPYLCRRVIALDATRPHFALQ